MTCFHLLNYQMLHDNQRHGFLDLVILHLEKTTQRAFEKEFLLESLPTAMDCDGGSTVDLIATAMDCDGRSTVDLIGTAMDSDGASIVDLIATVTFVRYNGGSTLDSISWRYGYLHADSISDIC
eukprot:319812_1